MLTADLIHSLVPRLGARLSRNECPVAILEREVLPAAASAKIGSERLRPRAVDIARERIR